MSKIAIVGTVGVPACYGGFESLVENLLDRMGDQNITVYCSSNEYPTKMLSYKGARLKYLPLNANGIQSVPYDVFSMVHAVVRRNKIILVLGVSGCMFLPILKLFSNAKIITNIDGLEWRRDKWGKAAKRFLKLSEFFAVKFSDVVVSDNDSIAEYVLNEYDVESEVIAYGGDHAICGDLIAKKDAGGYALALCRIEPENNVEMILEAFSKLIDRNLKFVGNWSNSDYGIKLKEKYSSFENIDLLDPIYDVNKLFEIRKMASIYIHGHSAGGTNPSLVEMMFFDIPIYCFDCVYNRSSTENRASFFQSSNDLERQILANHDSNSNGMLDIASRKYRWNKIANQYAGLFDLAKV